uniref:Uncharacterized protein n=1 Tax=Candidozyma auris TaxID=498019 RepID=A0A0L0P4G8_CANAR
MKKKKKKKKKTEAFWKASIGLLLRSYQVSVFATTMRLFFLESLVRLL